MHYIIYKTTNLINNKIYVGKHMTKNLNDAYMGSGLLIKKAIKKYGLKNFLKEILYSFSNEEEMNLKENQIVNNEFIKLSNTYNIALGGQGGLITSDPLFRSQINLKISLSKYGKKNPKISKLKKGIQLSENTKKKISLALKNRKFSDKHKQLIGKANKGKIRSIETKKQISDTLKNKSKEEMNNNAKIFILTNPEGIKHEVKGKIKLFCKQNNLSYCTLIKWYNKGKIKTKSNLNNWEVIISS